MRMSRFLLSAVVALSALASAVPAGAGPFDGTWIVSSTQNRGCGGNTNEMTVADGRVSGTFNGQNGVYSARGKITDEGKVKFNLNAGYVEFKGKVEGDSGNGTWNAGRCRGRFTMTRK